MYSSGNMGLLSAASGGAVQTGLGQQPLLVVEFCDKRLANPLQGKSHLLGVLEVQR